MFSFVCALPSPTSAEGCPPLFGWFTGSTAQSDFSGTCVSAVWFMAFADRPCSSDQGVLEISRFSCMLFLSVRGFSDYAGPKQPLAICAAAVLPSSYSEWSRPPDLRAFRSSIAPPTGASVYASRNTSRCPRQDSRSGWIRYFLSCRALASPTTCRFIPALSGLPVNRSTWLEEGPIGASLTCPVRRRNIKGRPFWSRVWVLASIPTERNALNG